MRLAYLGSRLQYLIHETARSVSWEKFLELEVQNDLGGSLE